MSSNVAIWCSSSHPFASHPPPKSSIITPPLLISTAGRYHTHKHAYRRKCMRCWNMHRSPLSSSRVNARHHIIIIPSPSTPSERSAFGCPVISLPPSLFLTHVTTAPREQTLHLSTDNPVSLSSLSLSLSPSLSLSLPLSLLSLSVPSLPSLLDVKPSTRCWLLKKQRSTITNRVVARATVTVRYHACKWQGSSRRGRTCYFKSDAWAFMGKRSKRSAVAGYHWQLCRSLSVCRHIHSLYRVLSVLRLRTC